MVIYTLNDGSSVSDAESALCCAIRLFRVFRRGEYLEYTIRTMRVTGRDRDERCDPALVRIRSELLHTRLG